MDCFAEPVIGAALRADPLARNDDAWEGVLSSSQLRLYWLLANDEVAA